MNQVVDKALRGMALLQVSNIRHWTDRTFSFNCERPQGFRFRSGEFVMIGLMAEGKPLVRAYSIASPSWDDELEFYSIKVQDGPLTSRLQHLTAVDEIVMRPKPVGTLVHDALLPGKRLFLFATGTGIAPFASIVRDPETYDKFDQVVLTHTCRDRRSSTTATTSSRGSAATRCSPRWWATSSCMSPRRRGRRARGWGG